MATELDGSNADYNQIENNLYLGNLETACDANILRRIGIKRILTIREVPIYDKYKIETIKYMHIPLNDSIDDDIITNFPMAHQFIHEGVTSEEPVLVHCRVGISRSATLVITYIMKKYRLSANSAIARVRSKRPMICPNDDFYHQMNLFQEMNYSLNPSHLGYRRHLLRRLIYVCYRKISFNTSEVDETILNKYFDLLFDKPLTREALGKEYRCKCMNTLFYELNVVKDLKAKKARYQCDTIFIEPQKWMWNAVTKSTTGSFACFKCGANIGQFNWQRFQCKCVVHEKCNLLVFKLARIAINE